MRRRKQKVVVEISTIKPQTEKEAVWMMRDIIEIARRCNALNSHRSFSRSLQKTVVKEFHKVMIWERFKFWKGLKRRLLG